MNMNEYQEAALRSAIYKTPVIYPALKLAGEAGEVAEKIGKRLRDAEGDFSNPLFIADIRKELGDVLWYIAALSRDFGLTLDEVASANIEKLTGRVQRGTLQGSGDNR
jgi:NTP pyrophosphatase (non-canonical NTP hydrolase)